MQEIRCPKCGEVFQVDESGYNQIAQQIRDKEFAKELERREQELHTTWKKELEFIRLHEEQKHTASITQKNAEIITKDTQITALQTQLHASENATKLAVAEAVAKKNTEIFTKDTQIAKLQTQLHASENATKLAVAEAVEKKNNELSLKATEISNLKLQLKSQESDSQLQTKSLQERYEEQLRDKDEQIAKYKDLKVRLSTKMIGESLEQHCCTQFNAIRMAAFPNAYFEKDNDAQNGSKGDFIYREYGEDGIEFISIMFEMKNEADATSTKHKNEDFFKKLDKDRNEKSCEYAILVSLLEIDNDLYNNGIVDVSYKYPKMYVIRPQFFIPIITLLRNAAQNSLRYRQELQIIRNQQVDIQNFEANMQAFKDGFARNYRLASEKFQTAIAEIDKTIDHLQKTKAALLSSENNLRLANSKADELSIKKLTKNAPSVKAMFDSLG